MRKFRVATFAAAAPLLSTASASAQRSTDPIKLTLYDWTGQLSTTGFAAAWIADKEPRWSECIEK
jgi:hypothetical protein